MQSHTVRCVDPADIDADALLAAARGVTPVTVTSHLSRCPACRTTLEHYQRLERLLVAHLDRRSCPPTLTIGEYAAGLLRAEEGLGIAAHLRDCPRCARERREFASFLSEDSDPPVRTGIGAALRRILLRPLTPAAGLGGMRGAADAASRTFAAEGVQLQLGVTPGHPGAGAAITGMFIEGIDSAVGGAATLLRDERPTATDAVDDIGSFMFSGVARGEYRVEIETADALLVIDPLTVP